MKLPESAGAQQSSAREISWQPSLGGEGKAWPGPQPHSHTAGHSWGKRASTVTVPQLHIRRVCRHFALFLRDDEEQELFTLYRSTGKPRPETRLVQGHKVPKGRKRNPGQRGFVAFPPTPRTSSVEKPQKGLEGMGAALRQGNY